MTESSTDSWPTVETLHGGEPPYAPPPPPPPPPEPDRRFGAGMLLALAVIALAAAGVAIAYFLTHRDNARDVTTTATTVLTTSGTAPAGKVMPSVTGEQLDQARSTLAEFGIQPAVKHRPSSEPSGTVLDQAPAAGGTLTRNTPVTLVVSTHERAATTSTQATATSSEATTTAPTTTGGQTTTAPAPAPRTSTVPDVSGQTEAAAVQSLNRAGIVASLAFVPSSDPLGTVEGQAKQAGTTVAYHSHMQINISSGPGDKPKEQVPNVIGKTLRDALASINGAQLRLLYLRFPVTSRSQAGKIVQQSPLAGAQAPRNAQVVVYLGAFSG